jgi:hypothetical protein
VDLLVAVERLLSAAAGFLAGGFEPFGQIRDRFLKAVGDRDEVLLVFGDECWVGLRGQLGGQVEDGDRQVCQWVAPMLDAGAVGDCAAPPGSCGKPPVALYLESEGQRCCSSSPCPG